jgi:hypothetical protein
MGPQPLLAVVDKATNRLNLRLTGIVKFAIDGFELDGKTWRVWFQSWIRRPQEPDPTLPTLLEVFPEDHPDYKNLTLSPRRIEHLYRAYKRQLNTGWHLKRVGDGIEGWFDLFHLPKESSHKNPFASFDIARDGTVHRCQFHISRRRPPREKPTEWDHSTGPKAGLPTLGKRRRLYARFPAKGRSD